MGGGGMGVHMYGYDIERLKISLLKKIREKHTCTEAQRRLLRLWNLARCVKAKKIFFAQCNGEGVHTHK